MLRSRASFPAAAVLAAPLLSLLASLTPPPPPNLAGAAGPGGVIDATKAFLAAIDRADADYLDTALAERAHAVSVRLDAGGTMRQTDDGGIAFYDVGHGGRVVTADSAEDFVDTLVDAVRSTEGVTTRISTVRADCPSEHCSFAIVEFDRVYGGGAERRTVPMRATPLLSYEPKATPHFRIFHWHASPRGAVATSGSPQPKRAR